MDVALEVEVEGREVTVHGVTPATTVAELAALVGLPPGAALVDRRAVAAAATLAAAGVVRGATLGLAGGTAGVPAGATHVVTWTTGPAIGRTEHLAPGVHVVGRAQPNPWLVTIPVGDGVPAPIAVRPAEGGDRPAPFAVVAPADDASDSAGAADASTGRGAGPWTVTLNRPPRPPAPPAEEPLVPPRPPADDGTAARAGGVLPTLVSLVGSAVAALVLRQPMWLLLGGLGAVAALTARWQQRRHDRRAGRRRRRAEAAAAASFASAVAQRHAAATATAAADDGDVGEAVRRARRGAATLWERRPAHADAFAVALGRGDVPWAPALAAPTDAAADAVLAAHAVLRDAAVALALAPGVVLGIVGPRRAARAVTRSLVVQTAVHHGPADVRIVALAAGSVAPWAWLRWLPHATRPGDGRALIAAGDADVDRAVAELDADPVAPGASLVLAVVDGAELLGSSTASARALVAGRRGPCAAVILAEHAVALPASCTHVLTVDATGTGSLRDGRDRRGGPPQAVRLDGIDRRTATDAARALARFDDPDLAGAAVLPPVVGLVELLGAAATDGVALARAWRALGPDPPPRAPVAVAADGVVELDLERDGPHALVAGTTGAGKSELLRTWVAALAVRNRPTDLTFVLVDYKGGAAFDACASLPHVVGMVTDLDDALAERALVSLEAEVRRRERLLRAAGATDLAAYRRRAGTPGAPDHDGPLPRLVVVVDEFAALAAELPGFLHALVDVARRGRSLGVHLVLATQRPGGAVSDDVRANTNLRIALRVQDAADAVDVVGDPGAARLPRDRPGRVVVRLGPSERFTAQAAWCTGPASDAPGGPWVAPAGLSGAASGRPGGNRAAAGTGATDLDRLVAAARAAHRALALPDPRRPWLPPLPDAVALPGLPGGALGLVDDPARQRQTALRWPTDGHLLVVGPATRGAGGVLAAAVLAAAEGRSATDLHVYVMDGGAGPHVGALGGLAHVGAVVRVDELERLERLVRRLRMAVVERRAAPGTGPDIAVAIDNLPAVRAALDEPAHYETLDAFDVVVADGAAVGVRVVATVERPAGMPARLLASFPHRWLLPSADAAETAALGAAPPPAAAPPGRLVVLPGGLCAQVAQPVDDDDVARAVAAHRASVAGDPDGPQPVAIRVLPTAVAAASLPRSRAVGATWHAVLGLGGDDLEPVELAVHRGDHLVVAGPPRSGKTEALRLLAAAHRAARPDGVVVFVPGRRGLRPAGPWDVAGPGDVAALVAARAAPALVLVDDADLVDDVDGALGALLAAGDATVVAAARPEAWRSLYGHWTQRVRRGRTGVLLRPQGDLDGDLLGVVLGRRGAGPLPPGRGYLVCDGSAALVQLARVPDG